jgi:hypothetical protein
MLNKHLVEAHFYWLFLIPHQKYYTYDYGDNWKHEIQVEEIFPPKPNVYYPVCIAGEHACPPEDCGGVTGE